MDRRPGRVLNLLGFRPASQSAPAGGGRAKDHPGQERTGLAKRSNGRREALAAIGKKRSSPLAAVYPHVRTGPKQVLRYLGRYSHRVAISNQRLIAPSIIASANSPRRCSLAK